MSPWRSKRYADHANGASVDARRTSSRSTLTWTKRRPSRRARLTRATPGPPNRARTRSRSRRARGSTSRSAPRSATSAATDALTFSVAEPSSDRYSSSSYSYSFLNTPLPPHADTNIAQRGMRAMNVQRMRRAAPEGMKVNDISSSRESSDALPHRRQLPDVPRLPRLSRQGAVESGGADDARGVRVRDDAAEAD